MLLLVIGMICETCLGSATYKLKSEIYDSRTFGYDLFHPILKEGLIMSIKRLGWIIVNSLDTMMIMNLTSQVSAART
jgi:O-antigen/teichoic acid export membrane protein